MTLLSAAIRLTFRASLRGIRSPAGDDRGEQGDHDENDCATDYDAMVRSRTPAFADTSKSVRVASGAADPR